MPITAMECEDIAISYEISSIFYIFIADFFRNEGQIFPQNSLLVRDLFLLKLDIKIGYIHGSLHRFLSESQEWENESSF